MLKLPKGLKKKKKDKKSKKNKELFTEEELEQYKREQRARQAAEEAEKEKELHEQQQQHQHQSQQSSSKAKTDDDEWSKFNQLTTGIDSILKKSQGNLDRIKEQSFFHRVTPKKPEPIKKVEKDDKQKTNESVEKASSSTVEDKEALEEKQKLDRLKEAVVELSESEEGSDQGDDIFDTNYIDELASGNVPLAYVPESPDEVDDGPDPFDTAYADKVIKGPEVSKRGKKIVNIGSAVEVLTGRVEKVTTSSALQRQRRGIQNLLLESFDKDQDVDRSDTVADFVETKPVLSLLDDPADEVIDVPIDLSTSLHLAFQQQKKAEGEVEEKDDFCLEEFEKDEFDDLATESLTKKEEAAVVKKENILQAPVLVDDFSWSTLEKEPPQPEESLYLDNLDDDDFNDADPFDTAYVETIIHKDSLDDDDFDPRAEERKESIDIGKPVPTNLTVKQKDLLSGSCTDLTDLSHIPVIKASESIEQEYDPFDTSAITSIVQPKATEIKFLEKELLSDTGLKHSISDPDFDPRAEEKENLNLNNPSLIERKSSLSLNISGPLSNQKTVIFAVPDGLTAENTGEGKPHKPLTPYYSELPIDSLTDNQGSDVSDSEFNPRAVTPTAVNKPDLLCVDDVHESKVLTPATEQTNTEEITVEDPFDTSNVSGLLLPGKAELKLIENEFIAAVAKPEIAVLDTNSDHQELGLGAKVLTPQLTLPSENSLEEVDPFDTSFAANLAPGQAEIKVLESELIHQ